MSIRGIWLKVRALAAPGRVERELDDEVRFHLERETEENLRRGMTPRDARREAYRRFGGVERHKELAREARGTRWLEDLARDARYGIRALVRSPAFTAAAVLTLTLGVGATTAVFSVVRGVLLQPLPFPEPGQLVTVWYQNLPEGIEKDVTSWPAFADWREQSGTLQHVVGVASTRMSFTGDGEPEEVAGALVTHGFFEMLGSPLALGRPFRSEEVEGETSVAVVVLGHGLWTRRFGGDPAVVGGTILLNDVAYEVVGVAAPEARYPSEAEFWLPLTFAGGRAPLRESRGALWLPVVGRLADGVSLAEARQEMDAIGARLAEAWPEAQAGTGVLLEPLHETLVGDVRLPLLLLLGSVVLVLLIAAANVANLLLARGTARAREMAVRLSLGARRGRLARQVLTESAVLGLAGGSLGVLLAVVGVRVLVRHAPPDLPRLDLVAVDVPVLLFALGVALATSLLFGLVPAFHAGRDVVAGDLREGGRTASDSVSRLRKTFVAAQFALALVLLAGSGLLVRSFVNLQAVDPGLEPRGVLTFRMGLPEGRYPDAASVRAFHDELLPALEALPGVQRTAAVSNVFLSRLPNMARISVESRPELGALGVENPVPYDGATRGFVETLGMRLTEGRSFGPQDDQSSPRVAVVSQTFARTFLPGRDPLGERFLFGTPSGDDPPWITVVGVVEDAKRSGLDQSVRPYVFLPTPQFLDRRVDVLVRTAGDPLALAETVRRELARLDPALPLTELRTLEQAFSASLDRRRFLMFLLVIFAGSATLLAAIGVYGVTAYLVGRRTREIGIQVALGATSRRVVRSILGQALGQAGWGVAAGVVGALVLTRLLRSQLFGLEPGDPLTFVAVSALLVSVAAVASWVPAARATRIHPAEALRAE